MVNDKRSFVIVTTDFSDAACAAYREAAKEARGRGSALLLLHVVNDWGIPFAMYESLQPDLVQKLKDDLSADAARKIEDHAKRYFEELSVEALVITPSGCSIGDAICDLAAKRRAEVIVIGSRGHGVVSELILGSVAQRVLHRARCPVLVVKP